MYLALTEELTLLLKNKNNPHYKKPSKNLEGFLFYFSSFHFLNNSQITIPTLTDIFKECLVPY